MEIPNTAVYAILTPIVILAIGVLIGVIYEYFKIGYKLGRRIYFRFLTKGDVGK